MKEHLGRHQMALVSEHMNLWRRVALGKNMIRSILSIAALASIGRHNVSLSTAEWPIAVVCVTIQYEYQLIFAHSLYGASNP